MSNQTDNRQPREWARPKLTRLGTMRDVAGPTGGPTNNGQATNRFS